jgi:hypothetical protein
MTGKLQSVFLQILNRRLVTNLALIIGLAVATLWYWSGIAYVPFHPDESSTFFMSADWETLLSRPLTLVWQPDSKDPRQLYRLLDAPLSRYLVGFARSMAGNAPLSVDWNWSQSWDQNNAAGALPSDGLLNAGRFGPAALFPLSLLLIFQAGSRLGGRPTGFLAALFLAANALVLLHTRRAMAEGGLVFTVCLFLACLVRWRKRPWLIALPAALAFCAKQSTLPLAIVGFAAVIFYTAQAVSKRRLLAYLGLYSLIFIATIVALNPFLWAHPVDAVRAAVLARQDLLARQTTEFALASPGSALDSPWMVALSLVANQFITIPATAEVGNYLAQTELSTQMYLANPLHVLLRDMAGGGILLVFSSIGFFQSLRWRNGSNSTWLLVTFSGIAQFLALMFTVTLPFQRYIIPLVPFSCLWMSQFLVWIGNKVGAVIGRKPVAKTI